MAPNWPEAVVQLARPVIVMRDGVRPPVAVNVVHQIPGQFLEDPGGAGQTSARVPNAGGRAIYPGRMLRPDQYAALAAAPRPGT